MERTKSDWINTRYSEIENEVAVKLRDNEQFKALRQQRDMLAEKNPFITQLLEGKGAISITEEEHTVFVEYIVLQIKEENMERKELYCFGHADCIAYLKQVGVL